MEWSGWAKRNGSWSSFRETSACVRGLLSAGFWPSAPATRVLRKNYTRWPRNTKPKPLGPSHEWTAQHPQRTGRPQTMVCGPPNCFTDRDDGYHHIPSRFPIPDHMICIAASSKRKLHWPGPDYWRSLLQLPRPQPARRARQVLHHSGGAHSRSRGTFRDASGDDTVRSAAVALILPTYAPRLPQSKATPRQAGGRSGATHRAQRLPRRFSMIASEYSCFVALSKRGSQRDTPRFRWLICEPHDNAPVERSF